MNWDTICYILSDFGIIEAKNNNFDLAESLLLLDSSGTDCPGTVYITAGETGAIHFRHALIVSIGGRQTEADNLIRLERGDLAQVFNTLAAAKHRLDALNAALALCDSDQEIIDLASRHLSLPMFYLDASYRVLAMTQNVSYDDDPEWIHMTEKGYLSPLSARRMKEAGDLDLLAAATKPVVYDSDIYPFASIVCNVWLEDTFVSRLNILCVNGDHSPLMVQACQLIISHLSRIVSRSGKLISDGPLQSMLIDLLHGVRLSEDLISDRLKAVPHLAGSLMQLFLVDVEARTDRQIASYYASLLKRLYPEETFIPLVFQEQLILLAYAPNEPGFDTLTVKLAHFFTTHHLRCGVSNPFRKLSDLQGYFEQAAAALNAERGEGVCFYRDIMLDRMLSYIPSEQARFLISRDIARLEEASADYAFSLVDTLKVYLDCNCNLNRAAERLFLHKNTLLYRLNHIRSILRCDLNDADERLLLMLSFKLLDK